MGTANPAVYANSNLTALRLHTYAYHAGPCSKPSTKRNLYSWHTTSNTRRTVAVAVASAVCLWMVYRGYLYSEVAALAKKAR